MNSLTSEAVAGVNELKRKRQARQSQKQQTIDKQDIDETQLSLESVPINQRQHHDNVEAFADSNRAPTTTGIYGFDLSRIKKCPLSSGVPFGGDSLSARPPPPVGFKNLLIDDGQGDVRHAASAPKERDENRAKRRQPEDEDEGSSLSLYEGDTWSRMWFQRIMILTLIRLLLFIRKVYEDYSAFRSYKALGLAGHYLISAATLFLPTLVFTIYRIARYLQIALPSVRAIEPPVLTESKTNSEKPTTSKDSEDAQSRRALMSSPTDSIVLQQQKRQQIEPPSQQEEDGLATARQTPTNLNEEFHDTQSEQQIQIESSRAIDSSETSASVGGRKSHEPRLESVDVNKLGNLPDKQTTRIILGASEQLIHGILFIFWQLKRQVDVVGYLVERSCLWRKPKQTEKQQLGRLRFSGDGLEWFQDFYAAFLAILVQVYSLGAYWSNDAGIRHINGTNPAKLDPLSRSNIQLESSVSVAAKAFTGVVGSVTATSSSGDLLIMSEIVVSCMVVTSLLLAVRRHDDGPLTLGLSMLGWGSIFAARIIVIALAFVHVGWLIMLPLVLCHIVAITAWIYRIAMDSHNGKADETEEHKWAPSPAVIEDATKGNNKPIESSDETDRSPLKTSTWSLMEHLTLICQVVTLFAVPSLFYWPIMFNLKLHARPFKYLALIMSQNFLLIAAIWYQISLTGGTPAQWYLLGTIGAFSIVGFIFIALYVACKPSLTEYFARADEIINEAEKSGIYYEFCSRVFRMPDLTEHAFTRLMNQHEQTVVELVEDNQSMSEVQLD